jgi:outer membrane receptor protein involved in Fe transport
LAGLFAGHTLYAQTPSAAADTDLTEIVVTGSRVITNGDNSPTPVTIVSTEQLMTTTPRTVVEGLLTLPVFSGGRSPETNPGNSSQNGSYRSLDLRNMGVTRTLVMFDGKRVMSTTPQGEVDADFVPSMLLQRVDVVTGGASAVYGSDAVTGVVNFITDRHFNGVKVDAHYGISARNDGPESQVGLAGGTDLFGGRGHIEGSFEYFNSPGIFSKAGRPWGAEVITVNRASSSSPYHLVYDTRLNNRSFGGYILPGNNAAFSGLRDMTFTADQNGLTPFRHGTPVANGVESGGDGGYYNEASLLQKDNQQILFGRFDYDVSDTLHFYTELTGMNKHNENNHQNNEVLNWCISTSNPYFLNALTPAQRALVPANLPAVGKVGSNGYCPANTFLFGKIFNTIGVLQPDATVKAYSMQFDLAGDLGTNYKWELFYVPTFGSQRTRNNNNIDNFKMAAASDAVTNSDGQIVCQVSTTAFASLYPGCVPINLFGPTSETQDMINYVTTVTTFTATTKMHDLGANLTGAPISTWAGPVNMALSAEWHTTHYDVESNASDNQAVGVQACTVLRFNCPYPTSPLRYVSNVLANRPTVSQTVAEGSYEFDLPLAKDAGLLANALNLNGAARYARYSNSAYDFTTSSNVSPSFTATTWKLGLDWHMIDDQVTIRATRSRDIRAPNLIELFNPRLINPAGVNDVHTGITASAPFITDPNPNLVPEVSNTWTAGIVLRPEFIPNFSLAVDWYQLRIANAITTIQGQSVTIQNICEASNGTSPYCALIQRPLPFSDRSAANFVTAFYSKPLNAQMQYTRGIDFEANYTTALFGGKFSTRALVSYQPSLSIRQIPEAAPLEASGTAAGAPGVTQALPTTRAVLFLKYKLGSNAIDVQERWWSGLWWQSDRTLAFSEPEMPPVYYTALTLTHDFDDKGTSVYFSINNLFDRQPTAYGNIGGSSGVPGLFGGYVPGEDLLGRYYTLGLHATL